MSLILLIPFLLVNAQDGCLSYFTTGRCMECETNYYLKVSDDGSGVPNLICALQSLDDNCADSIDTSCTRCDDGFYLTNNQCKECPTNCNLCSSTACYQCADPYILSTDQQKCVDCSNSAEEECGYCQTGKYFNSSTGTCVSCSDNCVLCTNQTMCYQCENKHYLSSSGTCEPITNCATYSTNEDSCLQCQDGFLLNNGACVECSTSGCKLCYIDDNSNEKCSICLSDYIWSGGECVLPSSIHCFTGSEQYGCSRCNDGYYLDGYNCLLCDTQCTTCINSSSNCLTCADNYYIDDETKLCVKVDENCNKYDASGCRECISDLETTGYYVPTGEQRCTSCNENCILCEDQANWCTACITNHTLLLKCLEAQMGYCTSCAEGYFIGSSLQCVQCDVSCGSCEDTNVCLTCAEWYYKSDESTLCSPMSEINMTCTPTSSGCNGNCLSGYYSHNSSELNCTICPLDCLECAYVDNDVVCTSCDVEMYLDNGKCGECYEIEHCLTCKDNVCVKCDDGYQVEDGTTCRKNNTALIASVSVVGGVILILLVIATIVIVTWRMVKPAHAAKNKPFKVTSDLALTLLTADNSNFPLKTKTWELTFGLDKTKAIVDVTYYQDIHIANTSKTQYFFEILTTPSHRYTLDINPSRYSLPPDQAITLHTSLTMHCTASVTDDVGIVAMGLDDQAKETAKFSLVVEADLSLKLDHTDLIPTLPAIGEGAFGVVFRGEYRGRSVAIKKMKSRSATAESSKDFRHEVAMLTQLRHHCIVEFIGAVYTTGEISIVTEFAAHGNLSKLRAASLQLKIKIINDLAVALNFLHENHMIHRDIKGENVLLFSLNPNSSVCGKLTDFGTCRSVSERNRLLKELTIGIGTPSYMPPECLLNGSYGVKADIYSFAIVMYETYVEHTAYSDEDVFDQPWKIPQFVIDGKRLEEPDGIPQDYWDLVKRCWAHEQDDRPTSKEILDCMKEWNVDIKYAQVLEDNKLKNIDISEAEASDVDGGVEAIGSPAI
ncbi:Serine-threonine protein kinase [Entamoeba marina]